MKNLIGKLTFKGIEGELFEYTGKDKIKKIHSKYPEEGIKEWRFEVLIDGEREYICNGHKTKVKNEFYQFYLEQKTRKQY